MRKLRVVFICLLVLVVVSILPTLADEGGQEQASDQIGRAWQVLIISDEEIDRRSAEQLLLANRKDTIRQLLSIANGPVVAGEMYYDSANKRNIAISLLGHLRAKEAVGHLVELLTPKPGQNMTVWERQMYSPAGKALIEIGLPSIQSLVERLKSEQLIAHRRVQLKIIVGIKGLPETELLFERIVEAESDSAKRQNLEATQAILQDPKVRKVLNKVDKRRGKV